MLLGVLGGVCVLCFCIYCHSINTAEELHPSSKASPRLLKYNAQELAWYFKITAAGAPLLRGRVSIGCM